MNTGKTVQFRTPGSVIAAYTARDCPAFAIWAGKQFLFKYDGSDIEAGAEYLSGVLELLQGSAGIYTLAVYEDGGSIKSNTPYDGSFNFRFLDESSDYKHGSTLIAQQNERLDRLEKMLIEQAAGAHDDDSGGLGQLGRILENPIVQQLVPVVLPKILGLLGLGDQVPAESAQHLAPVQKIAGIPETDRDRTLRESIEVLNRHVDIYDVLHWLAVLSSTNPVQFKMIVGAMEQFRK